MTTLQNTNIMILKKKNTNNNNEHENYTKRSKGSAKKQ